jgi:adenylate cyclase
MRLLAMRLLTHRGMHIFFLLVLLGAAVLVRMQGLPGIERFRQLTFDGYNKLVPRPSFNDVLIVDIDEESLRRYGQWPWPRTLVGDLPVILRGLGAKAVAFDMAFAEADRTSPATLAGRLPQGMENVAAALRAIPDNDTVFAEKMARAGNVITGFVEANQPTTQTPVVKAKFLDEGIDPDAKKFVISYPYYAATLPKLSEAAAGSGSFTTSAETDGIIRYVPLVIGQSDSEGNTTGLYPALSMEALRVALGKSVYRIRSYGTRQAQGHGITDVSVGDYTVPTDEMGRIWVYYAGHRQNLYVPAWKVLAHELTPEQVKGKIVLIGISAVGLLDLRSSPLDSALPGVEIHAEIIEQILHGQFLKRPGFVNGAELIATILISLFIIFVSPFIDAWVMALLGILLVGGGSLGGIYAYKTFQIVLDPVYPSLIILAIFIVSSILTNVRTEIEKSTVRNAFSQYLSPVLIKELTSNPEKLKLGGEIRTITVMFTDIRNFTTISQNMNPSELMNTMSDFLTPMTSCVLDSRGTVDKYIGDAMMAFWNAPLDDPEHAAHAMTAALAMQGALVPVNEALKAKAARDGTAFIELKAGIGVHTGPAAVGNMGSKQRFAYSALGDAVNLASRLEAQTKAYGVGIIASEAAVREAPGFAVIEIDHLTVKGRTEATRIYALLGDAASAADPAFRTFSDAHRQMLAAYRAQEWDEADRMCLECFRLRPDLEKLYMLYRERTAFFRQTPPAQGWAGIWVASEK